MSGLHRTYIGQIERGEKNISFANLLKVSGVLDVTMSELLAAWKTALGLNVTVRRASEGRPKTPRIRCSRFTGSSSA